MDRAEKAGFGIAAAGHLALLAALSLGFAATRLPPPKAQPIEVSFVDEVAPTSQAPTPSVEAPAPKLAEEAGPPEPAAPPPLPAPPLPPQVQPSPQPRPVQAKPVSAPALAPTPRPAPPKPAPAATARPAPAKPAPEARPAPATSAARPAPRSTGRLSGLLAGLSDSDTKSRSTAAPAATAGPAVQASLRAEIQRQLKPHWRAPTGADVELLRTQVTVTLSQSGAVVSIDNIATSGETPSNRSQVKLHQEQAVRAVRLAAPFRLPPEYYDAWKVIRPTFDRRLSQ
jgi:outer membrane biosynthesis protein TonB